MTHPIPARKPLDSDAFFEMLRGLHPSKKQLDDIAIVEKKISRDRLGIKDSVTVEVIKGTGSQTADIKRQQGKPAHSARNTK